MEKTKNFNLNKPSQTDYVNIEVLNENMDIIDQHLKQVEDDTKNIEPYKHPSSHSASMIEESTGKQFVSSQEKNTWNSIKDFGEPENISSGKNLNNYKSPGFYKSNTSAVSASLYNCPTRDIFTLFISAHGSRVIQFLYDNHALFIREYTGSGWKAWASTPNKDGQEKLITDALRSYDTSTKVNEKIDNKLTSYVTSVDYSAGLAQQAEAINNTLKSYAKTTAVDAKLKNYATNEALKGHLDDTHPHTFTDGSTKYRYGFGVSDGKLYFDYEEVR